ncbi:hypothetical protein [Lederbergia galactosidilytica]|uniref:Uncharacterized protein n=1 Tax=Lederbergia galactosidilytica TaxID=217031 RepID=A0A178A2U2_9BACI|nr:hypothetical protein [Lederbergia galactosidilytica]OAK74431.1 hypothetical protein ABB05_04220 [Lederbergia galactosidilytica]
MEKKELAQSDKFVKNNVKMSILEEYKNNTVVRGLIQLVPFGGLIDTMVTTSYQNILVDRSIAFFEELNKGNLMLTPEVIESEDFLHAYFSTYKAALYTRQRQKIRFFSRLLCNGLLEQKVRDINEYDDYLKILDELSYREICILYILYEFEQSAERVESQFSMQKYLNFWNEFLERVSTDLYIDSGEVPGLINRLSRTGCYSEFAGGYMDHRGGPGHTTGLYQKLVELIQMKKQDLSDIKNFK